MFFAGTCWSREHDVIGKHLCAQNLLSLVSMEREVFADKYLL